MALQISDKTHIGRRSRRGTLGQAESGIILLRSAANRPPVGGRALHNAGRAFDPAGQEMQIGQAADEKSSVDGGEIISLLSPPNGEGSG